jgi:hypothetical protein
MMGTMAASMVGSVAGNYVANKMFGGHDDQQPEKAQQEQPPPTQHNAGGQQQQQQLDQMKAQYEAENNGPCGSQFQSFNRCTEANKGDTSDCKWAWHQYAECKNTPPATEGFSGSSRF